MRVYEMWLSREDLPNEIRTWIQDFDGGREVRPIRFAAPVSWDAALWDRT